MKDSSSVVHGKIIVTLVSAFALTLAAASFAQTSPEGRLWTVISVQVHQDMVQEFEELQKELNAAYKAAGVTERRIYQVVRGPSAQYQIGEPVTSFADYDDAGVMAKALGEAGAARWVARVTKCVKDRRVDTYRNRPDLSVPVKPGRSPKLVVMSTRRNAPGHYADYNEWLLSKWMPAVKQAGMDGHYTYRNAFGGHAREWVTLDFVDSWAAFDEPHPVHKQLGDDGWQELREGTGQMTDGAERMILLVRPDLSIVP
jgi:hypothetical protein